MKHSQIDPRDRYTACLLGGAVGDALGAVVEFMSHADIVRRFGPQGIADYAEVYGGRGRITDDTQMTLFTAEGLLRGYLRYLEKGIDEFDHAVARAYLRWLATQGCGCGSVEMQMDGWLFQQPELHSRRAPGTTCLTALQDYPGVPGIAANDSKGCGGVMRVAPVGLFWWSLRDRAERQRVFADGCMCAALTHGHPSGYLTAGVLAVVIFELLNGLSLLEALASAKELLAAEPGHDETLAAVEKAVALSTSGRPHQEAIRTLGEGWVAEEALAIALYCALVAESFEHGIVLAVNHDGDSDSTGAIAGHVLGLMAGTAAIPERWLAPLELRMVIETLASDIWACRQWHLGKDGALLRDRYPDF